MQRRIPTKLTLISKVRFLNFIIDTTFGGSQDPGSRSFAQEHVRVDVFTKVWGLQEGRARVWRLCLDWNKDDAR